MDSFSKQISHFVQGSLIFEQFIWSLPLIILCGLGVINEMQNITYIAKQKAEQNFKGPSEINIITSISRPNTYLRNTAITSYFISCYLITFFLSCIIFAKHIKFRSTDMVFKQQLTFNKNFSMKILMQYINISINLIKYGFGYMAIEICVQNVQANLDDVFQILINLINILTILILILFLTNMFTYNWALDFQREYLFINYSCLTNYRIFIRIIQIVINIFQEQNNMFFVYIQIFLPIISSLLLMYQIQYEKLLIYGLYYQVILIITIMTFLLNFQFLFHYIYPEQQFHLLWILLSILPYKIFQSYIKRDLIFNFINFLQGNIQSCNQVVFQIIYNFSQSKRTFQSNLVFLMFLQQHSSICQNSKCRCKDKLQENEISTISIEIFFRGLLQKYEQQLLQKTSRNIQESLIFSYMQLLFFQKKYLLIYKHFKQILDEKSNQSSQMKRSNIQIKSLNKLLILKVAQELQRQDIEKQFQIQRSSLKSECQQNHLSINEYLKIRNQNEVIKERLQNIIQSKIKYFECLYEQNKKENLEQLALQSISMQIEGIKIIQASFQHTQTGRYQNILQFYNMEILNDLISAHSIIQPHVTKEDYLIKIIDKNFINQYSNMTVLIQDIENIQIIKHKYNQLDQPHQLTQLSFDQMIPTYVKQAHKLLIENFISGGQNKFFQQINQTYIEYSSCLCTKIDLIMDLSQLNLQSIEMIVFCQKKTENSFSIFLDQNQKIINIEEELFSHVLNIDQIFAQQLNGMNINLFFENFSQIKINEKYFSIFFRFFDQRKLNLLIQRQQDYSIFTSKDLITYQCDLEVVIRQIIFQQTVYQLNLSNIRRSDCEIIIQNSEQQNTLLNESIIIDKPQDFNQQLGIQNLISYQNNISNKVDIISQDDQIIYKFQQEDGLFTPKEGEDHYILSQEEDEKAVKNQIDGKQHTESLSLQTSLSAIQKSKYYKQFLLVQSLTACKKIPNIFLKKIILIIIFLIISKIGFFLYLSDINNFNSLLDDFKLLSFKNNVLQPISSFTLIRFSIINYNLELYQNLITEQQFCELVKYPNSKILESYDKLKERIIDFLDQELFFSYYSNQLLQLEFLEYESQGIQQELNMRNSLITLLNYQYDSQIVYNSGGIADQKSPYFFYTYKNFNILLESFQQIDTQAFQQLRYKTLGYENQLSNILIYSLLLMSIVKLIISIQHYQQCLQKDMLKQLLYNQESCNIISEIQRLHNLKDLVKKNYSQILNYKFNFQEKDKHFTNIKYVISKQNQKQKRKKLNMIIDFFNVKTFLLIISHFLVLIAIYVGLEIEISNAYFQIRNAAQFYQQLNRMNVNILVIYTSREILYYRQIFSFLNQKDIDKYYENCRKGINELDDQLIDQSIYKVNSYFLDSSFNQLINGFNEQNLCNQLEAIDQSLVICNSSLSGSLQKGLTSAIVDIKNSFKQEFEQSNFTNRTSFPVQELEGITILSQAFQYLIVEFYSFLFERSLSLKFQYNIIIIICFVGSVIYGLVILKFTSTIDSKKYELLLKFIYVVPLGSIVHDDNFQRKTRSFFVNQQLI